jgi:hypothetical protein
MVGDGGGAVAQPARGRADTACSVAYALATLALALYTYGAVRDAGGGQLGAPLDDSYIHFQFARSFAQFRPFEYAPGAPPVPGATSLLWPALLVPAIWLGASASTLVGLTWFFGFGALFGQACELYLAGRRFLSRPLAFAGGLLALSFSANAWFAASAMEVVPLGYLLLRCARRAAEFVEEAKECRWRRRELLLLSFVASLLRPEGLLGALCVALAFALRGRRHRVRAAVALLAPLCVPLVNLLFTGNAAQTTTLAKWLPSNPYYRERLLPAVLGNLELFFGTLLNGEKWSWTFIPEGYRLLALACLPALWLSAELRRARLLAALLCLVGLGMLIPATYETFLVNRLRYLWPFSGPWLLGLAALGELLAWPLSRKQPRLAWLGLGLPGLASYGFLKLLPISVSDVAQSAAAITLQQVSLGEWAKTSIPRGAKIGVNDAGAIAYFSEHPTFDVVGLTTRGEARYWVAGAGSRFEHYERLARSELPEYFIVYPEWFAIPQLLGDCLTERRVEGATILGGVVMRACRADYASLGSGAKPSVPQGRTLDELDVADLESEAAHGYAVGLASSQDNVVESAGDAVDGGRGRRTQERFRLRLEPGGSLVMRVSASVPSTGRVTIAGRQVTSIDLGPGQFSQASVDTGQFSGVREVSVEWSQPVTVLHYWSVGRVL